MPILSAPVTSSRIYGCKNHGVMVLGSTDGLVPGAASLDGETSIEGNALDGVLLADGSEVDISSGCVIAGNGGSGKRICLPASRRQSARSPSGDPVQQRRNQVQRGVDRTAGGRGRDQVESPGGYYIHLIGTFQLHAAVCGHPPLHRRRTCFSFYS